jgi:glycosyltransferase 2 family protein
MGKRSYWIGLGLSMVFLFLFFRKIDFTELWESFKAVDYAFTIPLMAINIFTLWIRAKRWGYLLKPIKKVATVDLFKSTAIGFMANNIFPARLGEIVRAVHLGQQAGLSKATSLATIVVERLFDGYIVLFLFLMVIFFMNFPPDHKTFLSLGAIQGIGLLCFIMYTVVLGILLLLRFQNQKANQLLFFFIKHLPERLSHQATQKIGSFVSGLDVLKQGKNIFIVILYSFFLWLVLSFSVYFLFLGFHLPLTPWEAFFLEILLVFGVTIPSAPGFIGTFHWVCAAGLIYLGVEGNQARAFAVVLWLIGFIPVTGLGLIILWREGLSLTFFRKSEG